MTVQVTRTCIRIDLKPYHWDWCFGPRRHVVHSFRNSDVVDGTVWTLLTSQRTQRHATLEPTQCGRNVETHLVSSKNGPGARSTRVWNHSRVQIVLAIYSTVVLSRVEGDPKIFALHSTFLNIQFIAY